jgi:Ca2+-binding EF-hand superfamily protein
LLQKGTSKPSADSGNHLDRKQFRDSIEKLGMKMTGEEFRKLWSRFDSSGDGSISYAEFNTQIGPMVSPPCMGLQMNRPETPIMKEWQRKNFAKAVKKKVQDIEATFKAFDLDGSGKISHAEFIQAMRRMGIRGVGDQESWQIMQKHRRPENDSGEMLYDEFKDTMMEFLKVPTHEISDDKPSELLSGGLSILKAACAGKRREFMQAFKEFDKNGQGEVNYEQFRTTLDKLGVKMSKEQVNAVAKEYDALDDGGVYYKELITMLTGGEEVGEDKNRIEIYTNLAEFDIEPQLSLVTGKPVEQSELPANVAHKTGLGIHDSHIVLKCVGLRQVIKDVLTRADLDKDGCLTGKEMIKALSQLNVDPTPDMIQYLISKYAVRGNGQIDIGEFLHKVSPFMGLSEANLARLDLKRKNPLAPPPKERQVVAAPATTRRGPQPPSGFVEKKEEEEKHSEEIPSSPHAAGGIASPTSHSSSAFASTGRDGAETVNTANMDLSATHAKMKKVLGRSMQSVMEDVKKKTGSPKVDGDVFRDHLASAGVPLTGKEVRAIALKYGDDRNHVQVDKLLAASGRTAASPSTKTTPRK